MLKNHPRQEFASYMYILQGMSSGFRVGFNRSCPLSSVKNNMHSASKHPEVVAQYLSEELEVDRILGPFLKAEAEASSWHVSKIQCHPQAPQG